MDFKALIETIEYDFLRTNPRLGNRIMLLGVSGSYLGRLGLRKKLE